MSRNAYQVCVRASVLRNRAWLLLTRGRGQGFAGDFDVGIFVGKGSVDDAQRSIYERLQVCAGLAVCLLPPRATARDTVRRAPG